MHNKSCCTDLIPTKSEGIAIQTLHGTCVYYALISQIREIVYQLYVILIPFTLQGCPGLEALRPASLSNGRTGAHLMDGTGDPLSHPPA